MLTKKDAINQARMDGRKEMKNDILDILDSFIDEQRKCMDAYPKNTKFIELQIDILEEFKEKLK